MFDEKELSMQIRKKKKMDGEADLRQDLDWAGQTAVDPNEYWDEKQNEEINKTLGDPDHAPASPAEMGENEDSQSKMQLKKSLARINKYFDSLL